MLASAAGPFLNAHHHSLAPAPPPCATDRALRDQRSQGRLATIRHHGPGAALPLPVALMSAASRSPSLPCAAALNLSSTSSRPSPTKRSGPPLCSLSARSAGSRNRRRQTNPPSMLPSPRSAELLRACFSL